MAKTTSLRSIPGVDRVLSDERVQRLMESHSRQALVDLVREELDVARAAVLDGGAELSLNDVVLGVERHAVSRWRPRPRRVINATGVILHTNLGRAPLSARATEAVGAAARAYSDLEIDLDGGERGSRQAHVSQLLCQLTGAEAAHVVNNNASAVMLGLAAVASGGEVVISRSEAVEIGGGFRIPDVLRQSGATLVEVGTTNRTYAKDYEQAITDRTSAILSVHASNFKIVGFTHAPGIAELVAIGKATGVPVLHDLGSGCLVDTARYGMAQEPMPQHSVNSGVDLAFFSGDKLLGGPQAGIVVGRRDPVKSVSSHPLARALRIDKLSLAGLVATLLHYVNDEVEEIPVWGMIAARLDELEKRARHWQQSLGRGELARGESTVGGGSLPGELLPTWLLSLETHAGADALARDLRTSGPPVLGRIEEERVLLDPRTVLPEEEDDLLRAVAGALDQP